jgi:hypothetical protein
MTGGGCPAESENATENANDFRDLHTRRLAPPEGRVELGDCETDTRAGHFGGNLLPV